MGYSRSEDCSQGRALGYTQTPLIGEPAASLGRNLPVNSVTFRTGPSWRSKCIAPSYVEIAFRPLLSNPQSGMPDVVKSSHRVVYTSTEDSLPEISSAISRTASQGSYLDFYATAWASAGMPLPPKKIAHSAIEKFLGQEHLGNPGLPLNYPESTEHLSRNILALDLSSTRTSLNRLLKESIQQKSMSDSQVPCEHLGAFSSITERRSRSSGRRKHVSTLRRSSSQSASWHSVNKPSRCNKDGQFLRILLGRDSEWIYDPKRNISYLRNNTETEGATVTEITSESHEDETILQDCQEQPTKIGYLQQFVHLASQFFLGWKTEERQLETPSASHGNSSVSTEVSPSCQTSHGTNCQTSQGTNCQTSHGTSSDTESSEINTHTTFSESQKSEPDHSLPENVDSLKESIQVPAGRTNVFEMLKRQFGGWTMRSVVQQERRQLLYDIDMGTKTHFANNHELALAIHNATSPYLKEFEQSNEIYNGKFYATEALQDVDYEQNGEYESLNSRIFKTEKPPKEKTSECKEETVEIQENARKSGTSERRGPRDKPVMWLKPGGKRSTRIEQKDNSRKQKHWYMRKSKLKRKALRVKDGVKSVFREGIGNEAVQEYCKEKEAVARGREETDTSHSDYRDYFRPAAATDAAADDDVDGDDDDDYDDDEVEKEDEQQQQKQQQPQHQQQQQQQPQQQQQKQKQLLQLLQQQQYKQPIVREEMSTDSISESTTDSCSLPKLHECNVKKWRENLVTWRKKRQELMSSCISNVGDTNERTQARRSGKGNRDNIEQSIKSAFSKLDLESIENDAVENSAEKIKQLNLVRKENTLAELKKRRNQEDNTLRHEATLTLSKGNGRESFTNSERQDGECRKEIEHYSKQADLKSCACDLRLNPQMSEIKDSSNLLKETEESERYRPSENIDRFHIARKSFFVNYQMYEDKWTERRSYKWFHEKYRSSEEEHKLLTAGQIATADNVREKQKLLKEVLEKMDEVAGGDKSDEKVQDGIPLDKWFSLLDALVKFNEKTEKDAKVKDEHAPETSIINKQDWKSEIGDCVRSDKVEIPELGRRKDFNLNKVILNWVEEGGSVGVKEEGDRKVVEKESTEMKHMERRISQAEHNKSAFEKGVSKAVQCSAEIGKNIVLGDMKSCEAKTKSSRNEYESSVSKKGKSKYQATVKVDSGIIERGQNGEQNRNTDKLIKTGKSIVVNSLKERVTTCKSSLGNYEQKERKSESSDRSKALRRSINREIQCSEINNGDKSLVKINSKGKEAKRCLHNDCLEKDTGCSPYGKDTSGQRDGSPMKLDFLSCVKENLDNFLSDYDHELPGTCDLETINLICSVLKANLDVEQETNICGTPREEMLIDANAEDNVGTEDASQDIQASERQQIPSQDIQESDRQQIPSQDMQESEMQQISSPDMQESETQQIPSQDIQDSEMPQMDLRKSAGAVETRSVDTYDTDSYADDSVDQIPGAHSKTKPDVSLCKAKVAPLKGSAVVVPKESLARRKTLGTIQRLLFSAGIVEPQHVSFLKQRLMEELEKFSKRNVRPIVEVPEMGSLIEPPQATPMFISRKSLEKVEEFLGFKISSWLAPGPTNIPEECSSSDNSLNLTSNDAGGPMSQTEPVKTGNPTADTQSATESEVCPQLVKLVENSRELTFYRPLLPIPPHYKCSCVDCCKNRRCGKQRPRRLRSRRTIVSSQNLRCKTVKNRSRPSTTSNKDAWANSDLERTSCVKPNKRIYSDRFFKKKISVSNILKLCKKVPGWYNPVTVSQITEPDCNEHEKLRLAKCLNAGDFEDKPKEDEDDRSSCSPEIQQRSHDVQDDPDVEDEPSWSESFNLPCGCNPNLHGVEHCYTSDSSYKSNSFHNHRYDTCRTIDYLENARAYTRTSPYASPFSQLPVSQQRPYCNISSASAFFNGRYTNNLYKRPQYTSSDHTTVWPKYRPPLFRQPFLDYLSQNCYSHRRPMLSRDCRPCPVGLSPGSCYSSPLLSSWGYSYPRRPAVSTSCPYTYRPLSPRRYTSTNYCSGCDVTSSTSFKNCPGSLSFSIHNYV